MPNDCMNCITFDKQHRDDFVAKYLNEKGDFDFSKLIPQPPEASEEGWDWYDWRYRNWGNKWNSYYTSVKEDGEKVKVEFASAWCPPQPVILRLAEVIGYTFEFSYVEYGMCFCGRTTWELLDGELKVIKEMHLEYEDSEEDWNEAGFPHPKKVFDEDDEEEPIELELLDDTELEALRELCAEKAA